MTDLPPPIPDPDQPPPAPATDPTFIVSDFTILPSPAYLLTSSPPHPPHPPAPDPWAHRRGEPRLLAFFWMMYILFAVAGSVVWVSNSGSVSPGTYSPAARIMLVVVAVGATILWPMVRLSQQSPNTRHATVLPHILADALIVLTPVQLVTWPLVVLANWPLSIVAAVAATLAAWVALAGGLLALALSGPVASRPNDPALGSRTLWMTILLAVVLGAPLATLAISSDRTPAPHWLAMLSPLTAIPTLAGVGISGPQNRVTPIEVQLIVATAILAVFFWLAAAVRSMRGERPKPA